MAQKENEEVLGFRVETKIDTALKQMAKFDKDMRKRQQSIVKSSQNMMKKGVKAAKAIEDANEDLIDTVGDLDDAYDDLLKSQKKSTDQTEDEVSRINAATEALKKKTKAMADARKNRMSDYEKAIEDPNAARKMGKTIKKEMQESLTGGFKSFLSKDAKGIVSDFGKLLQGSVKIGGLKLGGAGSAMQSKGKAMKEQMAAQGGGGNGMKAMATMMGGVGKAMEGLSKAAPLIAGLSTIMVKVVSLFIDAQAQVKQFNKDILQSSSTVEMYAKASGNAALANYDLRDTLDQIRDSAYDAKTNLDWGITSDTHKAVLNVLTQEGLSIAGIKSQADAAGKSVGDFSKELVTSSVAYFRLIGVPLQEINQLQAEMVTDLGMGIQKTEMAFSQMARSATESGIAANKFFGIIRGVSQDLSLWGSRMEDAVKLLTKLGKVMNPREAAKFMNTAMAGLKNMGRQERLRLSLLTGEGKMSKLVERDTKRKAEGLAKTLGVAVEDLTDPKKLNDAIKKLPEEQQGAARSAAIEMKEQMMAAGKGIFGKAIAGRTMGPAAALEAMKGALAKFGGGKKKLADMRGDIGPEMMAENLGISEEQLDQMVKFEASVDMTRDALIKTLQDGTEEEKKQARLSLKKGGIQGKNDAELITGAQEAGYDQIMDTLDEDAKKALEEDGKTRDFAKEQTNLQQSLLDKLSVYVDFFMNQFYNVVIDIWDGIMSIPGVGKSKEVRDLEKKAMLSRDPELTKAVEAANGDMQKFREGMIGPGGIGHGISELIKATQEGSDTDKEIAKARLGRVMVSGMDQKGDKGLDIAKEALKAAGLYSQGGRGRKGVGEEKMSKLEDLMEKGEQFSQAMAHAGYTEEEMQKALQKATWYLPPEALVEIQKSLKTQGVISSTSPQEKAADKAAAPGVSAPMAAAAKAPEMAAEPTPKAAPPPPTTPAAATQPAMAQPAAAPAGGEPRQQFVQPPLPQGVRDFQDGMIDQLGYLGGKNDDIIRVLKRAVKLDKSFVTSELGSMTEDSVLKAVRKALVEYKLYKDVDTATFAAQTQMAGFDPTTYGGNLLDAVKGGTADITGTGAELKPDQGKPNAAGGHVVGRNPDGTARVIRPPAGEMPAFVGPGETIGPKGGRGGGVGPVSVTVNGIGGNDLAQMVKVAATNAIYEYKRRENLH